MIRRAAPSLWFLLALLASVCFAFSPARAEASEPIRVLDQAYENHFPDYLRFRLKAEGDAAITQATLQYKTDDRTITNYSPAKLTPGRQVTIDHQLDLRRYYQPPGVDFRYRWQLRDETGQTFETEWTTFTLDDPRFAWRVLRADNLELRWYSGGDQFGNALLTAGRDALAKLRADAGVETTGRVRIYIYGSAADFQSAVDPGTHEWAGGKAFTREGVILIAAGSSQLDYGRRTVPHELSHVVVYQATKNPYGGLPTWLDEGLAVGAEGAQTASFTQALRSAVSQNRLISLWALSSSFPTDTAQAELSYAESQSVVSFLVRRYGRDGVSRLLAQFREGATYDDALKTALGVDTYGLDDAWRASLGLAPAALTPLSAAPTPAAPRSTAAATATLALAPTPATTLTPTVVRTATPPAPTPAPTRQSADLPGYLLPALAAFAVVGGVGATLYAARRR